MTEMKERFIEGLNPFLIQVFLNKHTRFDDIKFSDDFVSIPS